MEKADKRELFRRRKVIIGLGVALAVLSGALVLSPAVRADTPIPSFSGYLYDENCRASFDLFTPNQELDVIFTWPSASDFRVKVLGENGRELGDFALAAGPVIKLKGGGKFTIIVYSENGGGAWTAYYEP